MACLATIFVEFTAIEKQCAFHVVHFDLSTFIFIKNYTILLFTTFCYINIFISQTITKKVNVTFVVNAYKTLFNPINLRAIVPTAAVQYT